MEKLSKIATKSRKELNSFYDEVTLRFGENSTQAEALLKCISWLDTLKEEINRKP